MLFRVNSKVINRGEVREVFFIAESDHETMADIHNALVADGSLHVTRFETRGPTQAEIEQMGVGRRARFVTDDYEMIIHRDGFTTISEMMEDLIDRDGEAIFLMSRDAPTRNVGGGR